MRRTYFQSLVEDLVRRLTELNAFLITIKKENLQLRLETISKIRDCIEQASELLEQLGEERGQPG